ncbi:GntR family transcriptional regulator [Kitasatospora purpeofusca]|uniref:GntR family transcriptional regulator n=1 Tax=Kitasatospora purpeofusca TaxID=67352 RepID=UPI0035D7DB10
MDTPAYRQIADELRTAITSGQYPPDSTLPKMADLAAQRGVAKETVRDAYRVLEDEGLVEVVRRRGTVVRAVPTRQRISRTREVYRDGLGYYFDLAAQSWIALRESTVTWGPAPRDITAILGLTPGEDALIRDRLIGTPDTRHPTQLATSYLPASVARGTRLAEMDTGPGGIYDRLELDLGHGPLSWYETIGSRMPTAEEARDLQLGKGIPVLRIVRTATSPAGVIVEVNDTRMSALDFEVGHQISRHTSAEHPAD